nr:unnamed protein product [Digitaria exilis]
MRVLHTSPAIYGLATLFNRHRDQGHGVSSRALEVVWAPVLLIHLGGLDSFTAYNIEDNELWNRHLVSRHRGVSGDRGRLRILQVVARRRRQEAVALQAAILLFVAGALK